MRLPTSSLAAIAALATVTCRPAPAPTDPKVEVRAALAAYDSLILHMDARAIGEAFTEDGESSDGDQPVLRGPAAIQEHLSKFADFHVLADRLQPDSTWLQADTAWQTGTYWQRVRVPAGDTIEVRGRFEVTWLKAGTTGWHIRRMHTFRPPPS